MPATILAAIHDPGAAGFFLPVLRELHAQNRVAVLASEFTGPIFARHGIAFAPLATNLSAVEAEEVLAKFAPEILLSGTSWKSSAESSLRAAARGLRSVVGIDYWGNYRERGLRSDPDQIILVIDEAMRAEAATALGPVGEFHVCGHPYLEFLAQLAERNAAGADSGKILFLSEPRGVSPYDNHHPLHRLMKALPAGPRAVDFKLHPKEHSTPELERFLAGFTGAQVRMVEALTLPEGFLNYGLVAGYQSMGLFEAAVLGRRVAAFPSVAVGAALATAFAEFGIAVNDPARAFSAVPAGLPPAYVGSTQRVLSLLGGI